MRPLDRSVDASRLRKLDQQSSTWFRFESRTLAKAISLYYDDPDADEVQPCVPWLMCMNSAQ
jgi:hypothetical protein